MSKLDVGFGDSDDMDRLGGCVGWLARAVIGAALVGAAALAVLDALGVLAVVR